MANEDSLLEALSQQTRGSRYGVGMNPQDKDLLKALLKYVYYRVDDNPVKKILLKKKRASIKTRPRPEVKKAMKSLFKVHPTSDSVGYETLIDKGLIFTSARTPNSVYPKVRVNWG